MSNESFPLLANDLSNWTNEARVLSVWYWDLTLKCVEGEVQEVIRVLSDSGAEMADRRKQFDELTARLAGELAALHPDHGATIRALLELSETLADWFSHLTLGTVEQCITGKYLLDRADRSVQITAEAIVKKAQKLTEVASLEPAETGSDTPAAKAKKKTRQPRHLSAMEQVRAAYAKALLDHSMFGREIPTPEGFAQKYDCHITEVYKAMGPYKQKAKDVAEESLRHDADELGFDEFATKKRVVCDKPKKSSR